MQKFLNKLTGSELEVYSQVTPIQMNVQQVGHSVLMIYRGVHVILIFKVVKSRLTIDVDFISNKTLDSDIVKMVGIICANIIQYVETLWDM